MSTLPIPLRSATTTTAGYRFLLGEDHPVVRVGIKHFLTDNFPVAAIGEMATGASVLEAAAQQTWDLLILDIGLPGRSGLEILPELKQVCPRLPVLVLTIYDEAELGLRLFRGGIAGYVAKQSSMEELASAVQRILAGGKYVSPRLAEHIALSLDSSTNVLPHTTLSRRESQVLRLLAKGYSVADIAGQLSLDVRTIGTFRRHILRKLNLSTTQQIIYYAIHNGLSN